MLNRLVIEKVVQELPTAWEHREKLRQKGQFWTPDWVADAMVHWVLSDSTELFDPAVGSGAFFRAAKRYAWKNNRSVYLAGCELHEEEIQKAYNFGLNFSDFANLIIDDFIKVDIPKRFLSIVANPPYVRHHRLSSEYKLLLKQLAEANIGAPLDARSGLHVYFLIKALTLLQKGGKLAFILPSDVCEGKFAPALWNWIAKKFCLHAVVTFAANASPFPKVDTNPIVVFLSNNPPQKTFWWSKVNSVETTAFYEWVRKGFGSQDDLEFYSVERTLEEGLKTGLSRTPTAIPIATDFIEFNKLFKVMRGVATGCNDFFFLNSAQIKQHNLPFSAFIRAIGKTRDISSEIVTQHDLLKLDQQGQPTYLLFLNSCENPYSIKSIKTYLEQGVTLGLPERSLIKQRSLWYRMETRQPPPWLFAYLGRRNCRFIRNEADVVPLTGFLCVYERYPGLFTPEVISKVLNHPATLANLSLVGKNYGGGALKVEPRQLDRLLIPLQVAQEFGLSEQFQQLTFKDFI